MMMMHQPGYMEHPHPNLCEPNRFVSSSIQHKLARCTLAMVSMGWSCPIRARSSSMDCNIGSPWHACWAWCTLARYSNGHVHHEHGTDGQVNRCALNAQVKSNQGFTQIRAQKERATTFNDFVSIRTLYKAFTLPSDICWAKKMNLNQVLRFNSNLVNKKKKTPWIWLVNRLDDIITAPNWTIMTGKASLIGQSISRIDWSPLFHQSSAWRGNFLCTNERV